MGRDTGAEALADAALAWLADDPRRIGRFLALTGLAPGDLRALAGTAAFRAAVLEHLLADERLLLAFCAAQGLPPDAPRGARAALPGGDLPHWT